MLSKLKKLKENLRVEYYFSHNEHDKTELLKVTKRYKELIKIAKCEDIQEKLEFNKNNPKKLWKVLKSLYKEEKSESQANSPNA